MRLFYEQHASAIREALGPDADAQIRRVAETFSVDDTNKHIESIDLPGSPFPLHFRRNSSDFMVIVQIFVQGQYDFPLAFDRPPLIVDCGANIGCASIFFLSRHCGAKLIAVESEPSNATVCRQNLSPFGDQCELHQCAVWSNHEPLWHHGSDYMEWGCRVGRSPSAAGTSMVSSVTISELLESSGHDEIDLLKIDVEGSERELFTRDADPWLSRTRNLMVELHGPACREVFFERMREYQFELIQDGEVTFCSGIRPR
jgi:FkbM family methyltransferase